MIRDDFPLIKHPPYSPFCYVDNASTTQSPDCVIRAMDEYIKKSHANVHRAPYRLAECATVHYEKARTSLAEKYGISPESVVLTHGATDGLNLLASSLSQTLEEGDGVLLSYLDHHSMIVPWQMAANRGGLELYWAPLTENGTIDCEAVQEILTANPNIKVMSICAASNVLGTLQPIKRLTDLANAHNIWTIVDGCQMSLDSILLKTLHCDFWVISAHKMFGPTGIGAILAINPAYWRELPPYQSGGGMISMVTTTHTIFQEGYAKFEAGTPPIAAACGWASALAYIQSHDSLSYQKTFYELILYALESFQSLSGYKLLFPHNSNRCGVFSLVHGSIHPHDLATYLDHMHGIQVRAGHHCAMPLMEYLGIQATLRISLTWYNTRQDVDLCVEALHKAREFFNV